MGMRDILFRGKRVIDGKWVESCCPLGEMHSGTVTYDFDSKTVCQYTGLTDRDGRKIFEGDIVKHFNDTTIPSKFDIGIISWDKQTCRFHRNSTEDNNEFFLITEDCKYEVIGNIFDNPEMVGERERVKCKEKS